MDETTNIKRKKNGIMLVSYHDLFYCTDNLDQTSDPRILNYKETENLKYRCIIVVLQGHLDLTVNGIPLTLKSNDFLAITPNTTIKIMKGRCRFFSQIDSQFIFTDILERINTPISVSNTSYTFHHHHFTTKQIETLKQDFLKLKGEIIKPEYKLKEYMLRNIIAVNFTHLNSFFTKENSINHFVKTEKYEKFIKFLDLLDQEYLKERSVKFYAGKLDIEPKELSIITNKYTGKTASVVIDDYVAFRIKVVLYNNRYNCGEVAKMFNFESQSFFGRYFKRVTGESPRRYMVANSKKLYNR